MRFQHAHKDPWTPCERFRNTQKQCSENISSSGKNNDMNKPTRLVSRGKLTSQLALGVACWSTFNSSQQPAFYHPAQSLVLLSLGSRSEPSSHTSATTHRMEHPVRSCPTLPYAKKTKSNPANPAASGRFWSQLKRGSNQGHCYTKQ